MGPTSKGRGGIWEGEERQGMGGKGETGREGRPNIYPPHF